MIRSLHLILALVIALTAQSLAVARGQTMVAGTVVACVGGQAVTIAVDETGQPVGPVHICPDMALALMAGISFETPVVFAPATQSVAINVLHSALVQVALFVQPIARGPPLSV